MLKTLLALLTVGAAFVNSGTLGQTSPIQSSDVPAPIATVAGPEDESLISAVNGFIIYEDDEHSMRCLELPSRRDTVLKTRGEHDPFVARAAGPDRQGRIAYILDWFFEGDSGHALETMQLDGKHVERVFHRKGNTLWDHTVSQQIALSSGGLLAFFSGVKNFDGDLEIWDLDSKTRIATGLRGLDFHGLAWSPDGKRLLFVQRVPAATLGRDRLGNTGTDGFGKKFASLKNVPAICVYDLESKVLTVLHAGRNPVVSADGATVLVTNMDGDRWRLVDIASGASAPVSWPGGGFAIAFADRDLLLFVGPPTKGTAIGVTKGYSPLRGPRELPSLKLVRLSTGGFQTVLPSIDVRNPVGFAHGAAPRASSRAR